NGAPLDVYLLGNPTQSVNSLWTYGAYASDVWRLTRRLSLNIGLRFDRYRTLLPAPTHEADRFNPAQASFPVVYALDTGTPLAAPVSRTRAPRRSRRGSDARSRRILAYEAVSYGEPSVSSPRC